MADTFIQAYFHPVFAVKKREVLIRKFWKDELEKYITVIVQNNGHKLKAIGSMPDHIHILIGYNLNQAIPNLVEKIKTSSNHWIRVCLCRSFSIGAKKSYKIQLPLLFNIDQKSFIFPQ